MKTKIEIKNRFTGRIIFEFENEDNNVYKTINEYIRQTKEKGNRANLSYANLSYTNHSKDWYSKDWHLKGRHSKDWYSKDCI